jgi:hypothetical protein
MHQLVVIASRSISSGDPQGSVEKHLWASRNKMGIASLLWRRKLPRKIMPEAG